MAATSDLWEGLHGDHKRQVGLQQAPHPIQAKHQRLVPLLLLAVAAVVHQHLDADTLEPAQHFRVHLHKNQGGASCRHGRPQRKGYACC